MKQIFLVLIAVFALISCTEDGMDDATNLPENIFEGSVQLNTQIDVDDFGSLNYTRINGSLTIRKEIGKTEITDLSPLKSLTFINGRLSIHDNSLIKNLKGLDNIEAVAEDLRITSNDLLESISDLESLSQIGGELHVSSNNKIESLSGLDKIETVAALYINRNESLTSLSELNQLETVSHAVQIENNSTLTDFCGITNFAEGREFAVSIEGNNYNPTIEDIKEGYCSTSLYWNKPIIVQFKGQVYVSDECFSTEEFQDGASIWDNLANGLNVQIDFLGDNNTINEEELLLFEGEYTKEIELTAKQVDIKVLLTDYSNINSTNKGVFFAPSEILIKHSDGTILKEETLNNGLILCNSSTNYYAVQFTYDRVNETFSSEYTNY